MSPVIRQVASFTILGGILVAAIVISSGARLEEADVVFNNGSEISSVDPATVTGVPEGRVIKAIFEGLTVKHPKTLEPMPGVAERWTISDDKRLYTFFLRKDARWSNGDPVTARDFVYSWERFLNAETAAEYAYQLWYVEGAREYTTELDEDGKPKKGFETVGIRAVDDYTLEVRLLNPTPYFLELTAFYPLFPVNRRNIEEAKEKWPDEWRTRWLRPENLVTNGPYRIAFRRINDRLRLVKSETYWDADNVAMRSIDVLAVENYNTGLNLYLTGGADWIDRVPLTHVQTLMKREDFNPSPYLGSYFYRVNVTRPPFDDVRVRRALCLAIPRQNIVENITRAGQLPALGLVPPMSNYRPAEFEPGTIEDAKQLLVDAGYGEGGRQFPTIEIHYNTSEAHRNIAEVIADSWRRNLGIDAKLLNQEWKVYLDTQRNIDYDVSRAAWIGDYVDPNTFIDMFVTDGENNKTGWGNPRYDELVESAKVEPDPTKRLVMLYEAETILCRELPILPIYYYVTQNMVNPRLGGLYENIQSEHFPKFWYWMDDEELAAKRADAEFPKEMVPAHGPRDGLYSPAQQRARGG
ncbi:MAG: peptide ABC transporter substrate-binding protein [Planctomycetes bacterium]|nr:peptide ABC transporter substrate-binding protein [Planctomycetota bacterium]